MKNYLLLFFCWLVNPVFAQNVDGKWMGKLTQGPGGYSELYDIELILNHKKNVSGESIATYGDSVDVRIELTGYFSKKDTLILSENKHFVKKALVPYLWVACLKNFYLAYRREGNIEFLEGRWDGVPLEKPFEKPFEKLSSGTNIGFDTFNIPDECVPGRVILSRRIEDVNDYIYQNRDSVVKGEPFADADISEPIDFTAPFLNTAVKNVTTIVVNHPELQLQLLDYQKVDNDTVSVYLNRKPLSRNIRISKRAVLINFRIDPKIPLNELLLYAENLGSIPPNTSELIIVDGKKRHLVSIVSDKQKTAAVYLKYKEPE